MSIYRTITVTIVLLAFAAYQPACNAADKAEPLTPVAATNAADFVVDVKGPDTVPVGDMAEFTVGDSTATKFAWTVIPSTKNFKIDSSQRKAWLSGASGSFTIVLVGMDGNNLAIDTQTTTVGTGPIPIPPGPVPPGPTPPGPTPIPDGKLGFTKLGFEEGSKVTDPFRSKAAAVADNFDGTAAAIAAGTIKTVEAANAEMVAKNRATIGDAGRAAWLPFFTSWQAAADAAIRAGTLKASVDDYAAVYRATADGLRRIR